jgi:hypothetical protein
MIFTAENAEESLFYEKRMSMFLPSFPSFLKMIVLMTP